MKKIVVPAIIIVAAAILGYLAFSEEKDTPLPEDNQNTVSRGPVQVETEPIDNLERVYIDYSEENLKMAQESGNVLLFFHADWCPTCRSAVQDIVRNHTKLPENLTILRVDYDTQMELKRKYNVSVQHTMVQIDSQGDEITKWVGGGIETMLTNLK